MLLIHVESLKLSYLYFLNGINFKSCSLPLFCVQTYGATSTGATPTGPTLDPLNILIDNFSIA